MKRTDKYNLSTTHPHLIDEWHPTLNENPPHYYTKGSHKKVWWVCNKHGDYEQDIKKRTIGRGCPYCGHYLVHPSETLEVLNPKLSKEWDYEKNKPITPKDVSSKSGKKVWWICSVDNTHNWESIISNRNKTKPTGCPYCSLNRTPDEDYSFGTRYPKLVKELHPTKNKDFNPYKVSPYSKKRIIVWWRCPKSDEHDYKTTISYRVSGSNCPYCVGRKVNETNSLLTLYPKLIEDLHPTKNKNFNPSKVTKGSHKKVWWKCYRKHEWEAKIKDRVRGTNCPYCFSSKTSKPELLILSELSSIFDDVDHRGRIEGIECDTWIPSIMMGIEYDGAYYHKGKEKKDKEKSKKLKLLGVDLIRIRQEPLKIITRRDVVYKRTDTDEEMMLKLFSKIRLNRSLTNKQKRLIDKYIRNGELVNTDYFNELRTRLPRPPKNKTLFYLYPKISKEWDYKKNSPITPKDIPPKSNEKFWWICKNGHSIYKSPYQRHKPPFFGCGYCSGRLATKENNFSNSFPHLVKELHPQKNGDIDLSKLTPKSDKKLWWKCKNEHSFEQRLKNRAFGQGCPYCIGQKVDDKTNLIFLFNKFAKQLHPTKNGDIDSSKINPNSHKKYWFICKKGHTYEQSLRNKTRLGYRCPYCMGRYATKERNLKTLFPKIVSEWHPTLNGKRKPSEYLPQSEYEAYWLCENGHTYKRWISVRTRKPSILCPICKKLK